MRRNAIFSYDDDVFCEPPQSHTHGDVCHVALVCRRHSLLFRVKMRSSAMILIIIIALVKRKRSLLVLVSSIFKDVPHLIYNGSGAPLK